MKKNKKQDFSGATKDLKEIVKEDFIGNNEIRFFISERGNQRIEIKNLDNNEIWQTLESTSPAKDIDNFDEISVAMILSLYSQLM